MFHCAHIVDFQGNAGSFLQKCQDVILLNAKNCFQHPEFFTDMDACKQFLDIFLDDYSSRGESHPVLLSLGISLYIYTFLDVCIPFKYVFNSAIKSLTDNLLGASLF